MRETQNHLLDAFAALPLMERERLAKVAVRFERENLLVARRLRVSGKIGSLRFSRRSITTVIYRTHLTIVSYAPVTPSTSVSCMYRRWKVLNESHVLHSISVLAHFPQYALAAARNLSFQATVFFSCSI